MKVRFLMVAVLIGCLGVSACGKKGPLEPPKPSLVTLQNR
jgi:predicted small lipoprotein YifL